MDTMDSRQPNLRSHATFENASGHEDEVRRQKMLTGMDAPSVHSVNPMERLKSNLPFLAKVRKFHNPWLFKKVKHAPESKS